MMKHEFEALAGYEVSFEDYNRVIEPMYMATELSKEDFVKCIDRKRFALPTKAELLAAMRKEAKHLYDICGRCCDFESEQRLERLAHTYLKRVYGVDWTVDSQACSRSPTCTTTICQTAPSSVASALRVRRRRVCAGHGERR